MIWPDLCTALWIPTSRIAKEKILGPTRETVSGEKDVEKMDLYRNDSVFEETITSEYALIINGHSLVRSLTGGQYF